MKASLILTAIILLAGGLRLAPARVRLEKGRARLALLQRQTRPPPPAGIDIRADPASYSRRLAEFRESIIRSKLDGLIRKLRGQAGTADSCTPADFQAYLRVARSMTAGELRSTITRVDGLEELDRELRDRMISAALVFYQDRDPAGALVFLQGTTDFDTLAMTRAVLGSALQSTARQDPHATLRWFASYSAEHPALVNDAVHSNLLLGISQADPRLAFHSLAELEIRDLPQAVERIMEAAPEAGARTRNLAAFRDYLGGIESPELKEHVAARGLGVIFRTLLPGDFDSAAAWIGSAEFSPGELAHFANGIRYEEVPADAARWLGWMETHLDEPLRAASVRKFVRDWALADYEAAGQWLKEDAHPAIKAPAVQAFAREVARYDPSTAEQWAMTLPEGSRRDETLRAIHARWPAGDEAGKAGFAARHGMR